MTANNYTLWRHTRTKLHVGNRFNKDSGVIIFEPVEFDDCELLMSDTQGPLVLVEELFWPVRTYDLSYSLDRLLSQDRFKNSEHAISLYPFERQTVEGLYRRSKTAPVAPSEVTMGRPKSLPSKTLQALTDRALVLPTERSNEWRLLAPLASALAEIS